MVMLTISYHDDIFTGPSWWYFHTELQIDNYTCLGAVIWYTIDHKLLTDWLFCCNQAVKWWMLQVFNRGFWWEYWKDGRSRYQITGILPVITRTTESFFLCGNTFVGLNTFGGWAKSRSAWSSLLVFQEESTLKMRGLDVKKLRWDGQIWVWSKFDKLPLGQTCMNTFAIGSNMYKYYFATESNLYKYLFAIGSNMYEYFCYWVKPV